MRFKDEGQRPTQHALEVMRGGLREISLEKPLKIMRYFRLPQKITVDFRFNLELELKGFELKGKDRYLYVCEFDISQQ
jgi:hypothetical protein